MTLGLPDGEVLYFATFGEPVFDRLINFILEQTSDLPFEVIEVEHNGFPCAAIAHTDNGERTRLITSVRQVLQMSNPPFSPGNDEVTRFEKQIGTYCANQATSESSIS